ncbi:MAG: hydantoinase B/oxoprolinase family protein [Gemmatimonadaceae bacterium]
MTPPLALAAAAHALAMIAEEMGSVLVRGALSPNIRERRDASSALFDRAGRMIAQAAHIPVHLGAMPEAVRAVRARRPAPGDVYILNDPYAGGSHLPDLTVIEAIDVAGEVAGFAAVRAHHADVGGMSPGSMPQGASELLQEGLILPPLCLMRAGVIDEELLRLILANVRTPDERLGDLRAQLAAARAGAAAWRQRCERQGEGVVLESVNALLAYTERRARARIAQMRGKRGIAEDILEGDGISDDEVVVRVVVEEREGRLHLDFTGTSPAVPGNVNCPLAVTRAAAVFVLRTLLDADIPTNDGVAAAVDLVVPEECVLNARWPHAVAAGNVETSQRVADTIFAALANAGLSGVAAQGQGTMNNVMFGGTGWTFYETLGGGQGASSMGDGPSAVHVGMSNTRNTPIESLEAAYPIRIDTYAVRRGSGGAGLCRGGDGIVRSYRVLEACTVTLLTERRRRAPRGVEGGGDGAVGRNQLNGVTLPAKCRMTLAAGDVVTIETPGGGGWGAGMPLDQPLAPSRIAAS